MAASGGGLPKRGSKLRQPSAFGALIPWASAAAVHGNPSACQGLLGTFTALTLAISSACLLYGR